MLRSANEEYAQGVADARRSEIMHTVTSVLKLMLRGNVNIGRASPRNSLKRFRLRITQATRREDKGSANKVYARNVESGKLL